MYEKFRRMIMDKTEEIIIKHSMLLESQSRVSEDLRIGINAINRKLEDFGSLFNTQNELMQRLINLEKTHQESINRIHKRIDENTKRMDKIESLQDTDGCAVLKLKESQLQTTLTEIVENTKSNQKRIDNIEKNISRLTWLVITAVMAGVLKIIIVGI